MGYSRLNWSNPLLEGNSTLKSGSITRTVQSQSSIHIYPERSFSLSPFTFPFLLTHLPFLWTYRTIHLPPFNNDSMTKGNCFEDTELWHGRLCSAIIGSLFVQASFKRITHHTWRKEIDYVVSFLWRIYFIIWILNDSSFEDLSKKSTQGFNSRLSNFRV